MRTRLRVRVPVLALTGLALVVGATVGASGGESQGRDADTATPIRHLVVIFQENVSYDHYFGTYPWAANPSGEPRFDAKPGTPTVNGLGNPSDKNATLLVANPNSRNPQRLDRSQPLTCDQDHNYTDEQRAYDHSLMDKFSETVGASNIQDGFKCDPQQVLDYYDGNTVTALWNYAQHFSMNDNSFSTQFGPSTPGALNLTVGNTFGVNCGSSNEANPTVAAPCLNRYAPGDPNDKTAQGTSTVFGDPQPAYDICSTRDNVGLGGKNIGNLLNDAGVTWGWFNGGFRVTADNPATPQPTNPFGLPAFCIQSHRANGGVSNGTSSTSNDQALTGAPLKTDYIPHHEPFQYFKSTSNPMHLAPASVAEIGHNGTANHQYDLTDFWTAVDHGNMPAVSFLKARAFQDGHAQYSTPLDEQRFLVQTINRLQRSPFWHSTAVVVNYDDSDGWYDHVASPISIQSQSTFDALTGVDCGTRAKNTPPTKTGATTPQETRCGYGPRQPFVLISPWARTNFVDNTLTDQASITRFIEDNWLDKLRIGQGSADAIAGPITNMLSSTGPHAGRLFLNPVTGQPSEDEGDNRQE